MSIFPSPLAPAPCRRAVPRTSPSRVSEESAPAACSPSCRCAAALFGSSIRCRRREDLRQAPIDDQSLAVRSQHHIAHLRSRCTTPRYCGHSPRRCTWPQIRASNRRKARVPGAGIAPRLRRLMGRRRSPPHGRLHRAQNAWHRRGVVGILNPDHRRVRCPDAPAVR